MRKVKENEMNKKLISSAVAGLLAVPFAASADVTIYGGLHLAVDSYDTGYSGTAAVNNSDGVSVTSGFSFIGFSGNEDLGNGVKTVWQIENIVVPDEGGNNWASGNTYLGLSGDFGTAIAGEHDTPFLLFGGNFDIFDSTIGDMNTVMGNSGMDGHEYDVFANNALVYMSPDMGGLQLVAAYATDVVDNSDPDNNDFDATSVSMTYTSGSLMLGGAYEEHEDIDDTYGIRLGASMGMGATNVGVLWEMMDGDAANGLDRDAWHLYLTQGFGANTIKVAYTTVDESQDAASDGADMWAIGLDHELSKRTKVYVAYAALENENSSYRGLGGPDRSDTLTAASATGDGVQTAGALLGCGDSNTAGSAAAVPANGATVACTGQDPHALSIGLVHSF